MTPAARLAGAIEVLADILARRRPAPDALKDWGLARRFAGSRDRAAVASLVYDALRRKASAAWILGEETPRAILLGMLRLQRGLEATVIAGLCNGERHAPVPLTPAERAALDAADMSGAPLAVRCDVQEWLLPGLIATFGDDLEAEMQALARRASVDIRANRLRTTREELAATLAPLHPAPTPYAPDGLRFQVDEEGRGPALQAEAAFVNGLFEIQDEGSQLAALASGVQPGDRVVDLCAGAGGKTLALAALLDNRGDLHASDRDARRLGPLHARLARSGATNVTVHVPRGREDDPLAALDGTVDCVVVDAPCTGSGTWRRNPDSKWRVRPGALAERQAEQATVLDRAARLTRPGGRLLYITCSVLADENDGAIASAISRWGRGWEIDAEVAGPIASTGISMRRTSHGLQLSPARSGCDGFFMTTLRRIVSRI